MLNSPEDTEDAVFAPGGAVHCLSSLLWLQ